MAKRRRKHRSKFKTGTHVSTKTGAVMHYRSSYEQRFMRCLDADDNVLSYTYEKIVIRHRRGLLVTDDAIASGQVKKTRSYTPDFFILYADGRKVVIEIKPANRVEMASVQKKKIVAEQYCAVHGYTYAFKTLADIIAYENELEIKSSIECRFVDSDDA